MKTKNVSAIIVILVGLVISGCAKPPEPVVSQPPSIPVVTERPELSEEFVSRIDGSTATIPLMRAALQLLRGTDDGMQFNRTIEAYDNLIAGDKDVIFVTPPSKEELAAAKAAGVELEVIPVVKDALVFLANKANPVDGVTSKQIKEIYTGKTTNWKQVGGADQTIIPYQRQVNSGSQTLFLALAMGDTKPMKAPQAYYIEDMSGLVDHVAAFDNSEQALGYSVFYFTQEMYVKESVKLLAIDGVAPSSETIADDSYAYLSNYFAVMRKSEPADSVARQLVAWCLSDEGQQTFSAASYVPLEPRNIVEPVSGYGYQGSTPENTTQSSGTGGPVGRKVLNLPDGYPDGDAVVLKNGRFTSGKWPGLPKVEASINEWLAEIEQETKGMQTFDVNVWPIRDLVQIDLHGDKNFSTIIRLTDGHRMVLSDFFYVGVNYIEFVNRTLLNDEVNQLRVKDNGERIGPFTGFPADTTSFSLNWLSGMGLSLFFYFTPGNPFLADRDDPNEEVMVELYLPYDLSPYGYVWQIKRVMVNGKFSQHVVSNFSGVNPQDAKINAAADAWVAKQKGNGQGLIDIMVMPEDDTNMAIPMFSVGWALSQSDETWAFFDWNTCQELDY